MVWERVPQPRRIIAQTVCSNCHFPILGGMSPRIPPGLDKRKRCIKRQHPDWRVRYIVQPRNQAIFPPLHACRESRRFWLRRYFRPPRYLDLSDYGYVPDEYGQQVSSYKLRFDVPFISYEADVFTILGLWRKQLDVDVRYPRWGVDGFDRFFDPFLGLDRSRIQNVAVRDDSERLLHVVANLDFKSIPACADCSPSASVRPRRGVIGIPNSRSRRWKSSNSTAIFATSRTVLSPSIPCSTTVGSSILIYQTPEGTWHPCPASCGS
ncbi:hypothetical protein VTG60DRAFT_3765 [Thermothelomyces hinnuleus]